MMVYSSIVEARLPGSEGLDGAERRIGKLIMCSSRVALGLWCYSCSVVKAVPFRAILAPPMAAALRSCAGACSGRTEKIQAQCPSLGGSIGVTFVV